MYASHWKKIENLLWWTLEIFPQVCPFWNRMDRRNESEFFGGEYNIYFLSTWPFMHHPCFPTEKVSKVAFFLSQLKNSHEKNLWLFCCWKMKNATWHIIGQMLRKAISYPIISFRFIRPVYAILKQIKGNISEVHHRKFSFFFSCLHTSSMKSFCKNWRWLLFLLSKSQST